MAKKRDARTRASHGGVTGRDKASSTGEMGTGLFVAQVRREGQPRAWVPTTPGEYQLLGTVLATGWKAGKSVFDYYRAAKPATKVGVAVIQSEPTKRGYRLDFRFVNGTAHGMYLEEILLVDPDADALSLRLVDFGLHDPQVLDEKPLGVGPSMSFDVDWPGDTTSTSGPSDKRRLPLRVPPAETRTVALLVPPDAKLWFDQATMGIGKAKVSFLDQNAPLHVAWQFLIRRSEPGAS